MIRRKDEQNNRGTRNRLSPEQVTEEAINHLVKKETGEPARGQPRDAEGNPRNLGEKEATNPREDRYRYAAKRMNRWWDTLGHHTVDPTYGNELSPSVDPSNTGDIAAKRKIAERVRGSEAPDKKKAREEEEEREEARKRRKRETGQISLSTAFPRNIPVKSSLPGVLGDWTSHTHEAQVLRRRAVNAAKREHEGSVGGGRSPDVPTTKLPLEPTRRSREVVEALNKARAKDVPTHEANIISKAKKARATGTDTPTSRKAIAATRRIIRNSTIATHAHSPQKGNGKSNPSISSQGRKEKAKEKAGESFFTRSVSGSNYGRTESGDNSKTTKRLIRVDANTPNAPSSSKALPPPRRGKEESLEEYKRGHLGIPSEAEVDRISDRLGGEKDPLTRAAEKAKAARAKKEETDAPTKPISAAKALRVAVARRSLKGAKTGSGTWPAKKLSPLPPSPRVTFRQPKAPEDLPVAGKLRKVVKRVGKGRFIDATANERHGPSWVNPEHANAPARLERTHPRLAGMPHRSGIGHLFPEDALDRSLEAGHLDKILKKGEDRSRSGVSHATVGKVDLRYGRDAPNPKEGNPEFNPEGKKFDRTDSKAAELVSRAAKWKLRPNIALRGAKGKWPASRP